MAKKYKFKIGDWVKFKKRYEIHSSSGERYAYEIGMHKHIIGRVCGAVIRYLGKIKTDEYDYHNQAAYLVPEKSIILYQIRDGMINVPFEVKEEDIEEAPLLDRYAAEIEELPWKNVFISKSFREDSAKHAASMPRNAGGQFLKCVGHQDQDQNQKL